MMHFVNWKVTSMFYLYEKNARDSILIYTIVVHLHKSLNIKKP
jgi:hypothetical protein